MSIAYLKPLVSHLSQIQTNILSEYDNIVIRDLSIDDKQYLFDHVLPIVGKNEHFIVRDFFNIIKSEIPGFNPFDLFEKYSIVNIVDLLSYIEDEEDEAVSQEVAECLTRQIIDLALEKKIKSFKYDW